MSSSFLNDITVRRTVYALTDKSPIPDEKIVDIVKHAVLHTPSSFNSQSNRAIVLFGESSNKVWDFISAALKAHINDDTKFAEADGRVKSFKAGHGTILYFIDTADVKKLQDGFPAYAPLFPQWSEHSIGILQGFVWTALAKEGLGASLQHYSNLIGDDVKKAFGVPETWVLVAQQPFGVPAAEWKNPEKQFNPIDDRVKVFN